MRTHYCGDLETSQIGKRVVVCGWVHYRRDLGGLIFLEIRDRKGLVQVVFSPDGQSKDLFSKYRPIRGLINFPGSDFVVC